MSKIKKIFLAVLLLVLVAGTSLYFAKPDLFQGIIFRQISRITQKQEPVTKQMIDRFKDATPLKIDQKTIKRDLQAQFDDIKKNLPGQALISYDPIIDMAITINDNYESPITKSYLKNIKLTTTADVVKIPLLETYESLFEEEEVEESDLPDLSEYGLEDVPDNFLWIFTLPQDKKYVLIDPTKVTESNPKPATVMGVCNYGSQTAEISSIALKLQGGYNWGNVSFNVFHETEQLWDEIIQANVGDWPGDISLTPFLLPKDECTYFYVAYYDIGDGESQPDWSKFDLRGLGSNLPTYYLRGNYLVLLEEPQYSSDFMPGLLNVFNPIEEVLVQYSPVNEIPQDIGYAYDEQSIYLGNFNLQTLANSTANIENLTINLNTTYEDPLEATFYIYKYSTPWNFIYNYINISSEFEVTLQPGTNIVPFDEFLDYTERVSIDIYVKDLPGDPDPDNQNSIKLTLEDVETEAIKSEGDIYNKKDFDGKEGGWVFIGVEPTQKVDLNIYYSPQWSEGWYSEKNIASLVAEDNPPLILQIGFTATAPSPVPVNVNPFEIEVKGNFTEPLDIKIDKTGFGFYDPAEFISVLPGDVINVEGFSLENGKNFFYNIYAMDVPADAIDFKKYVGFEVPEVEAVYGEYAGIDYAGDEVTLLVQDKDYEFEMNPDFVFPIISGKTILGPILINAYKGYSQYGAYEMMNLDEINPEDTYTINNSCLEAQGNTKLYKFTYQHTERDQSPFGDKDIILKTNQNIIYHKDAVWTANELTFTLTNSEFLYNEGTNCLELNMKIPPDILDGTIVLDEPLWFSLIGVEATDQSSDNNEIKVYTQIYPVKEELSEDSSVKGTVFEFI